LWSFLWVAFIPGWRWLLDRDDSPWYLTARLFRQDDTRAWDSVLARVRAALHEYVGGRRLASALCDVADGAAPSNDAGRVQQTGKRS